MITTAILTLLYWILYIITIPLQALPDASLPASFSGNITTISTYISAIYAVFPYTIQGLMAALTAMITIELGIFVYKLVMWVIHRIPTQGGSSPG